MQVRIAKSFQGVSQSILASYLIALQIRLKVSRIKSEFTRIFSEKNILHKNLKFWFIMRIFKAVKTIRFSRYRLNP